MGNGVLSPQVETLDVFVELFSGIESETQPGEFYNRLCEALCRLTSMRRAVLMLYDESLARVVAAGSHGIDPSLLVDVHGTLEETPVAQRALGLDEVQELSPEQLAREIPARYKGALQVTTLTCTPMAAANRWFGVIFADRGGGRFKLTDDERDIDSDGLSNWVEAHGPLVREWWTSNPETKEQKLYSPAYPGVDWLDSDSDGDGLIDGLDDQDHDGWNNMSEVNLRPYWVNPYNPCLPDWKSPTCSLHPPPPENSWPPFGDGDNGFVPADGSPPGTPLTCAANTARCKNG